MRRTPGTTAPSAAAARGLGAVVLLALLALLHATFSPGPSHLSALDLDGCRLRAAAASTHLCETAAPVVVTAVGADGHQDGAASQSCDVSGYGPRQLADLSHPPAVSGTTSGVPGASSPGNVSPAVAGASAPGSPFGSVVLRC
ncbi:hypothetical protein OOK29_24180 [Streptomyces phaeochromogenes]|uniref:hypothetical protein n=1 Tax=Streptomyces phaeochromogenes TaxID=1923 RepID=UPI00225ABB09|nr:hypothetical protein [Streptomyces phaeochromogenes]MCX5601247.1 hypothetical protein [Streptomyces phaeochromogenes]